MYVIVSPCADDADGPASDLRLQLLEPERYPHLYKCLYGVLMLLPQSSAFAALKNRLNSVSAIGYLHIAPRTYVSSHVRQKSTETKFGSTPQTPSAAFDRPNRLKPREEGSIKWNELLEKFKSVQEKARRAHRQYNRAEHGVSASIPPTDVKDKAQAEVLKQALRPSGAESGTPRPAPPSGPLHKPKSSLGNLGQRFAGGVARKGKR